MIDMVELIIAQIKKVGRPLSIDELMPLCLPHTPHEVNPRTGHITYDREAFCAHIQAGMQAGRLHWHAAQVRGQLVYTTSELPRHAETHSNG